MQVVLQQMINHEIINLFFLLAEIICYIIFDLVISLNATLFLNSFFGNIRFDLLNKMIVWFKIWILDCKIININDEIA